MKTTKNVTVSGKPKVETLSKAKLEKPTKKETRQAKRKKTKLARMQKRIDKAASKGKTRNRLNRRQHRLIQEN